jgi:hypothetical protein
VRRMNDLIGRNPMLRCCSDHGAIQAVLFEELNFVVMHDVS